MNSSKRLVWALFALALYWIQGRIMGVGGDQTLVPDWLCTIFRCTIRQSWQHFLPHSQRQQPPRKYSSRGINWTDEARKRLPKDLARFYMIPSHLRFVRDVGHSAMCPRSSCSPALVKHHQRPSNPKLASTLWGCWKCTCLLDPQGPFWIPRTQALSCELLEHICGHFT